VKNGVPFDVAHALPDWELLGYAVTFAKFENGDQEFDWGRMKFIERR
jgi:hypothetical protein